jgi:beta-glucosidase-like glycosyl hydrolase
MLCHANHETQRTLDEKIGQIFAIAVPISSPPRVLAKLCATINTYHIGSVVLDRTGTMLQEINVINYINQHCTIKPLIAQDLENGLCMRLYDAPRFPKTVTCGAIQDNNLIFNMGQEIGYECKLLGIDINLAPVVDIIDNNQSIIRERAYGKSISNVTQKAAAFIDGIRSQNVYTCLKHFPGIGNTSNDPHLALPVLTNNRQQLNEHELYPFARLAKHSPCIMSAHVQVPAYDNRNFYSATLSQTLIKNVLKEELGFQGLTITDALRMEALTNHFGSQALIVESFNAGHDILLFPPDIETATNAIKQAIQTGIITQAALDNRVEKILQTKELLKTATKATIQPDIYARIHSPKAYNLKKKLYQAALTLLENSSSILPLAPNTKIAYVQIGNSYNSILATQLHDYYPEFTSIILDSTPRGCDVNDILYLTQDSDIAIIVLFNVISDSTLNFGIAPTSSMIIERLAHNKKVILVICGLPYCLKLFEDIPTIIMAYEDDPDAQEAAAQTITGSLIPSGKLPVTISSKFCVGAGA